MKHVLPIITALVFGLPAQAADLSGFKDSPSLSRESTLAGLYVDVFAGANAITGDTKYSYSDRCCDGDYSYTENSSDPFGMQGATIGGGLSYLFQAGKIYVGPWLSVDYSLASTKATESWAYSAPDYADGNSSSRSFEKVWGWGGGLMAGAEVSRGTLLYAKGGFVQGNFKISGADVTAANGFDTAPTIDGFTIGGGLRQSIGSGWSIGAEYLYTKYDDIDIWSNPDAGAYSYDGGSGSWSEKRTIELDEHRAMLVLSKAIY